MQGFKSCKLPPLQHLILQEHYLWNLLKLVVYLKLKYA